MQQEAAHELLDRERHGLVAAAALGTVVLELERHPLRIDADQAAVGDGHAMGIARQIGQHRLWTGEGTLGVDHPLALAQRLQPLGEGLRIGELGVFAEAAELAGAMRGAEVLAEQPSEQPREHPHGQEEARPTGHPALTVEGDATAGHDAMQVRMMGQRRAPGVQHRRHPDARPQVLGVGGDGQECLGGGREQQSIDHRLVVRGELPERCRQGENHVVVLDRQQVGLPRGEPLLGHRTLTLRAVAVAAGVVGNLGVAAVRALGDMAAERRRAAVLDGRHHFELAEAQVPGLLRAPSGAVVAEDVRDLQGRPGHGRLRRAALPLGSGAPADW